MSYQPAVNTVAWKAITHLQSLPAGAELMTSALAEAIGCEGKNIVPSIEAALANGLIFRRQRDTHARSPMWWSLTDHGARPKVDIRQPAVPVDGAKETPQEGANRDASAGQSHDAAGSASPAGRGTNGASARGAAPVFIPPEPGPQQVLKAEPATADATDRGDPDTASPRVGAMGAGQAADAAPAEDQRSETPARWPDSPRQGDKDPVGGQRQAGGHRPLYPFEDGVKSKHHDGAATVPLHPEGFRCALWSNGALQLERGAATLALLTADETRALVAYLERLAA